MQREPQTRDPKREPNFGNLPEEGRYHRDSIFTGYLNNIGSAAVSLLLIPIIVKKTGMAVYGQWSLLFLFIGLASLADMGISKTMVLLIAGRSDREEVDQIASAGLFLGLGLVILLGLASVSLSFFSSSLNKIASSEGDGRMVLLCGSFVAALTLATTFLRAILESFFKIPWINIGFLLLTILNYSLAMTVAIFRPQAGLMALSTVLSFFLVFLLHLILVVGHVRLRLPTIQSLRLVITSSWSFFGVSILVAAVEPMSRIFLAAASGAPADMGLLDISLKIAIGCNGLLTVISVPLFSLFAGYYKRGISLGPVMIKQIKFLWWLYVAGIVVFLLFGRIILGTFFPDDGRRLFGTSLVLVAGIAAIGVAEPILRAMYATGKALRMVGFRSLLLGLFIVIFLLANQVEPLRRISIALSLSFLATSAMIVIDGLNTFRRVKAT